MVMLFTPAPCSCSEMAGTSWRYRSTYPGRTGQAIRLDDRDRGRHLLDIDRAGAGRGDFNLFDFVRGVVLRVRAAANTPATASAIKCLFIPLLQ
jgi:hypothetical protein